MNRRVSIARPTVNYKATPDLFSYFQKTHHLKIIIPKENKHMSTDMSVNNNAETLL